MNKWHSVFSRMRREDGSVLVEFAPCPLEPERHGHVEQQGQLRPQGALYPAFQRRDAVAYIKRNLEFHRTLYLRAQAPAMLAMAETVWLQLGPTMSKLYGRLRRTEPPRNHKLILAALKAGGPFVVANHSTKYHRLAY